MRNLTVVLGVIQTIVIVLVLAFVFQKWPDTKSVQTLYPECHPRPLDSRTYCEVLGSDLFAASERLDGKSISLTGFLANDYGVLTVFPTEEAYVHHINTHALVVRTSYEKQKELLAKYGYKYVKFFGTYVSKDETSSRQGKVGGIRVVHADAVRIRASRKGPDELGINVEDLEAQNK